MIAVLRCRQQQQLIRDNPIFLPDTQICLSEHVYLIVLEWKKLRISVCVQKQCVAHRCVCCAGMCSFSLISLISLSSELWVPPALDRVSELQQHNFFYWSKSKMSRKSSRDDAFVTPSGMLWFPMCPECTMDAVGSVCKHPALCAKCNSLMSWRIFATTLRQAWHLKEIHANRTFRLRLLPLCCASSPATNSFCLKNLVATCVYIDCFALK